ncbi:MAG: NfeD family protein [Spirosomataceae bacterium]|jgi:membrane protein implicated in regulation of membrane protease activity|nr:NfeD family protein [Bacteroidota bacterium]
MELTEANVWIIVGVALLILEIFSTSFYALFFGIGALATGLIVWLGGFDDLFTQIAFFALSSLLSLFFFRNKFMNLFLKKGGEFKEIVDEYAKVSVGIPAGGEGKVFYRGSDWIAYEKDGEPIDEGAKVLIKKIDGIKLIVDKV